MNLFKKKHDEAPLIVGICGRSCSGKSIIADAMASVNRNVLLLKLDNYFKTKTPRQHKGSDCWERTDCLAFDRLIANIKTLKRGEDTVIRIETPWLHQVEVQIPSVLLQDKEVILLDGFLLFAVKDLVELLDAKIFIDVSDLNMLYRRLRRDNTIEGINKIYDIVIPVSKDYEEIQKANAEIIFDGNKPKDQVTQDTIKYLAKVMRAQGINLRDKQDTWEVRSLDLLSDNEWHPIQFENLKDWVKRQHNLYDGPEFRGNTFRYRRNLNTGGLEVRLGHHNYIAVYDRDIETPP